VNPSISAAAVAAVLGLYHYQGFMDMQEPVSRTVAFSLPILAALVLRAVRVATSGVDGLPLPISLIRVVDGDTIIADHAGAEINIRVYAIDAPEADQPYGAQAKQRMYEICTSGQLAYIPGKGNSYGRGVATVLVDGSDAGLLLIKEGLAWPADPQYMPPASYLVAHTEARDAKRGLFSSKNPIHPSVWRATKKQAVPVTA
jgi:endonuclease YncB( thermonuclease family)